jgi:hypothetical protein
MDTNTEMILDIGLSPLKDPQNISLEEKRKLSCCAQACSELYAFLSVDVFLEVYPFGGDHEFWTKIQDKYDVSKSLDDCCSPSTSGLEEFSSSSTSPTCDLS